MEDIATPGYIHAEQGGYYLPRLKTLIDSLAPIASAKELADFDIKEVFMRPVPPPPIDEREDCEPLCARDSLGRFKRVWWWEECSADHQAARAFYYAAPNY